MGRRPIRDRARRIEETTVTHLSDSDTTGYLSKYELFGQYDKQWSASTPTDVYVVELRSSDFDGSLLLSMNMETGALVAWQQLGQSMAQTAGASEADELTDEQVAENALQLCRISRR